MANSIVTFQFQFLRLQSIVAPVKTTRSSEDTLALSTLVLCTRSPYAKDSKVYGLKYFKWLRCIFSF